MCSAVDRKAERRGQEAEIWPLLFCLLLSAFLLLTGCASVAPVVKVALVGPFEGQNRAVGYDVIYSARLAVREVNRAGGIGSYRVSLVALDDGSDPELAKEVARSLVLDPAVVAVVGHWGKETTSAAAPIYEAASLPFIYTGIPPFDQFDPNSLPTNFVHDYEAVTPFEETTGPYAAPAYDAFQLVWLALETAAEDESTIDRTAVAQALDDLTYNGLTGIVYQPEIKD